MTPEDRQVVIAALHVAREVYLADAVRCVSISRAYVQFTRQADSALELANRLEDEVSE